MSQSSSIPDSRSRWSLLWRTPLRDLLRGRLTGRVDDQQIIDASALPAPVGALVHDVVKQTGLWRSERAEVARELVAHFADGLEGGDSVERLIDRFGDPGQTARLIRRAKKRNRPWPWRVLRWCLFAGLAIVAFYLLTIGYFLLGRPAPSVDYVARLNATASEVSEAERAWPLYRRALVQIGDLPNFESYSRVPRPGEIGWDEAERFLADHREPLALAREAAHRPRLGFTVGYGIEEEDLVLWPDQQVRGEADGEFGLFSVLLPHLAELRKLAKCFGFDARQAAAVGDGEMVVANIESMVGLANHVREMPLLINDLVAVSVVSLTAETLGDVIAMDPDALSDPQLQQLAHILSRCDGLTRVRLEGERIGFADLLQRTYTDDGNGDGRITLQGLKWLTVWGSGLDSTDGGEAATVILAAPALLAIVPSRREALEEYNRLMDQCEVDFQQPLWKSGNSTVNETIARWHSSLISTVAHMPLVLVMPAIGKAHVNGELVLAQRDAVLAAIALELHRRRHGDWPGALAELVPDLLPTVPADRFDGEPLRYRRDTGSAVVYSVGSDGDDDGGRSARTPAGRIDRRTGALPYNGPDGDWILWPRPFDPIERFEQ